MDIVPDSSYHFNHLHRKISVEKIRGSAREAALQYRAMGLSVLPIVRGDKCPIKGVSWIPLQYEPATEETIGAWYDQNPDAGVGIIAGRGLVVIDIDNGEEVPAELEQWRDTLQSTACSKTVKGYHYFLAGGPLRNSRQAWGDVRGAGGYVVAAPSYHPSGARYQWLRGGPIQPMPDGLRQALMKKSKVVSLPEPATAPVRKTKAIKKEPSRAATSGNWLDKARDPATALAVMRSVGVNVVGAEEHFISPLRPERKASAILQVMDDGVICFTDYGAGEDPVMLPDVWRAIKTGRPLRTLGKGERILWWLRALKEVGIIETPTRLFAALPDGLPDNVPDNARRVYAGFVELLELRTLYDPGKLNTASAPYSIDFIVDWCGLKGTSSARAGLSWLRKNLFLIQKSKGAGAKGKGGTAARYFLGDGPDWLKDIIEGDRAGAEPIELKAGRMCG